MHGNVWEWCQDWYAAYDRSAADDPTGPSRGSYRVRRCGSWYFDGRYCRSAYRILLQPGLRNFDLGFRVSQVVDE
jgi:formylglycine-generating enzyme required for sulfatase activity